MKSNWLKLRHKRRNNDPAHGLIERNLEVIKTADWVIDLGPEGGDGGGHIVAEGRPEDVAKAEGSYTGRFLADLPARRPAKTIARAPKAAE